MTGGPLDGIHWYLKFPLLALYGGVAAVEKVKDLAAKLKTKKEKKS